MAPLNRYFITLLPPAFANHYTSISLTFIQYEGRKIPFKLPVPLSSFRIRPFVPEDFIRHLEDNGPPPQIEFRKSMRSQWTRLYWKFINASPNFHGWLQEQRQRAQDRIRGQYVGDLTKIKGETLPNDQLVTYLLAIRRELVYLRRDFIGSGTLSRAINPLLLQPQYGDALEFIAKRIWERLEPTVQAAFTEGLFDPLVE
jgi:hypothetical protein